MAKNSSTTRRGALGMAALALPVGVRAATARPTSPDAALVAMCDELLWSEAEAMRVEEPYWHDHLQSRPSPADQARIDALNGRYRELFPRIAETPAATAEGRRAKARVCLSRITMDTEGGTYDDTDDVLVSLLRETIAAGARA